MRRLSTILILAAALAVALQLPSPRASADSKRVVLKDLRFSPVRVDILVGDAIVWEAKEDGHTVTARNGEFDSGSDTLLQDDDEFRWRFKRAGSYPYFCRVHGSQGMQGEVVVLDDSADRGSAWSSTTSSRPPRLDGAAATAPSETMTTAEPATTTTAAPTTTTTYRPLATSSTVNLATTNTIPAGVPVSPNEPPAIEPDVASGAPPEASVPGKPAALRHRHTSSGSMTGVGLLLGLPAAAAGAFVLWRRRRTSGSKA